MKAIKPLLCALLGHKYLVLRIFSPVSRQLTCTRCKSKWGMHDTARALVDWDDDLESAHRAMGQWK